MTGNQNQVMHPETVSYFPMKSLPELNPKESPATKERWQEKNPWDIGLLVCALFLLSLSFLHLCLVSSVLSIPFFILSVTVFFLLDIQKIYYLPQNEILKNNCSKADVARSSAWELPPSLQLLHASSIQHAWVKRLTFLTSGNSSPANKPFIWSRCVGEETHLKVAWWRISRTGLGRHCSKKCNPAWPDI